jgi:hypothetical protein
MASRLVFFVDEAFQWMPIDGSLADPPSARDVIVFSRIFTTSDRLRNWSAGLPESDKDPIGNDYCISRNVKNLHPDLHKSHPSTPISQIG